MLSSHGNGERLCADFCRGGGAELHRNLFTEGGISASMITGWIGSVAPTSVLHHHCQSSLRGDRARGRRNLMGKDHISHVAAPEGVILGRFLPASCVLPQ